MICSLTVTRLRSTLIFDKCQGALQEHPILKYPLQTHCAYEELRHFYLVQTKEILDLSSDNSNVNSKGKANSDGL